VRCEASRLPFTFVPPLEMLIEIIAPTPLPPGTRTRGLIRLGSQRCTFLNAQLLQASEIFTPCNRTNRSHEGCGEEWEGGDVVWLRLRLDDQLDAGAGLEGLGEVALPAEGDYVVVKGLEVAV
jgi:hypothetical protein